MALKVWLPLNGNLDNQGLSDITVTNNSATVDNNGKIGKCYNFDGTNDRILIDGLNQPKNISVAFWIKRNANTGTRQFLFTAWGGVSIELTTNGNIFGKVQSSGGETGYAYGGILTTDSGWTHVVYTFQDKVGGKIYINGELKESSTSAYSIAWGVTSGYIGNYSNIYLNAKMNDFRIYDHVLSPKEVKELSKGLTVHYLLNDIYNSSNLIINGYGELGTENWANNKISTQVPPNQSDIKASFYDGNITTGYILINPMHSYTLSGYFKSTGATSGYTYPSIYPYDTDKNFIANYNCPDGFLSSSLTTLKQSLKTGDTIIYANDLSQWNTDSGNYYYHVAIFGYKDSNGTEYPQLTYTQDSPVFGTYSDKSHINKTNNTITLNSPYTGVERPAGTAICQATEGGTYCYPFGAVALSSVSDWVHKTVDIIPYNLYRLRYAKYWRYSPYWTVYNAGIKLVDNTWNDTTIYDCSGYQNNGTVNGSLTTSNDTARYSVSTYIPQTGYIQHPNALGSDIMKQEWTCCAWVKLDTTTSAQRLNDFNLGNMVVHSTNGTPLLYLNGGTHDYYRYGSVAVPANTWTHIAFVFKNSDATRNVYINGVLTNSSGPNMDSTPAGIPNTITLFGGNFSGRASDYREYATALSADDIKELYETSASIDNNGNMFAYEFIEETE